MRRSLGLLALAAATTALSAPAGATEVYTYTFSGQGSYETAGSNTGGYFSFTFTSPQTVEPSPGYGQYVYGETGTVTLTPYGIGGGPVVTGVLSDTYTLIADNQGAGSVGLYYGPDADTLFSLQSVGTVDLTTTGTLSEPVTDAVVSGSFIYLSSDSSGIGNDYVLLQPDSETDLTFTVAQAAVPEPAGWSLMIVGAAVVGGALRRRSRAGRLAAGA
jgi:hypothetical protein